MFNIKNKIKIMLSLPRTVWFNFRCLPVGKALKLPLWISNDVEIGELHRNVIYIDAPIKMFMIKIGTKSHDGIPENSKGFFSISRNSRITFQGESEISHGSVIRTIDDGVVILGKNFFCNKNCELVCRENIYIGDDVLLGWNVSIRDSDGGSHKIIKDGIEKVNKKGIRIDSHVWICSHSHIMKGVTVMRNSVVAYNSCVTRTIDKENVLIGGYPAQIIQENIDWRR